jgi:DNA-3-methyladenine glycosylase II
MRFSLEPTGPYDLARTAKFGVAPPLNLPGELFAPLLDFWHGGEYRRCIWAGERPVLLRLRDVGGVERPRLEAATWPEQLDRETQAEAEAAARRIVDADTDLNEFYHAIGRDARLARLAQAFRGLKIFRSPSLHESLVVAVLEQQVNFNFAGQVKAALVARYGTQLEFGGARYPVFPAPRRLAALSTAELRGLKISGQKANYIRGLSEAAAAGLLHPNGSSPTIQELIAYKGVGPWTANYVALRVFGARDALPSQDVGLLKAARRELNMRGKVTPARLERRLRPFAGWRGYVTWYLWHTEWEKPVPSSRSPVGLGAREFSG